MKAGRQGWPQHLVWLGVVAWVLEGEQVHPRDEVLSAAGIEEGKKARALTPPAVGP